MFQRFRRGEKGAGEGSGLGLSLVARVAQLHRATISLLDADGASGLRVDVAFPPMPRPAIGPSSRES
jgi:signal transduction histidine kinase